MQHAITLPNNHTLLLIEERNALKFGFTIGRVIEHPLGRITANGVETWLEGPPPSLRLQGLPETENRVVRLSNGVNLVWRTSHAKVHLGQMDSDGLDWGICTIFPKGVLAYHNSGEACEILVCGLDMRASNTGQRVANG